MWRVAFIAYKASLFQQLAFGKLTMTPFPIKNDFQEFELIHLVFRVDNWFLMSSVWPTVGLCALYYFIIRLWGPKFMKDREPYNIQTLITAYNLFQTLFSLWIFYKATKFWLTGTRQLPSRDRVQGLLLLIVQNFLIITPKLKVPVTF